MTDDGRSLLASYTPLKAASQADGTVVNVPKMTDVSKKNLFLSEGCHLSSVGEDGVFAVNGV